MPSLLHQRDLRYLHVFVVYLSDLGYSEFRGVLDQYFALLLKVGRVLAPIHPEEVHLLLHLQLEQSRHLLLLICHISPIGSGADRVLNHTLMHGKLLLLLRSLPLVALQFFLLLDQMF